MPNSSLQPTKPAVTPLAEPGARQPALQLKQTLGVIMSYQAEIESIRALVESGDHLKAIDEIKELRIKGCNDIILILFEALAEYDAKRDVECLRLLSSFISKANRHKKYNYALFTSGLCLMNLGLASEAKQIFNLLPDNYPGINTERKAASLKENKQHQGLLSYASISKHQNA